MGTAPTAPEVDRQRVRRFDRVAVASFVVGIVAFTVSPVLSVLAFPVSLGAIICGHVARRRIRRSGDAGNGLAITGLSLGYSSVVVQVAVLVVLIAALKSCDDVEYFEDYDACGDKIDQPEERNVSHEFISVVNREAVEAHTSPRDPEVIRRALCDQSIRHFIDYASLPDGARAREATAEQWANVGWRVEIQTFERVFPIGKKDYCVTIPRSVRTAAGVVQGPCR
jgi:Domain of unknown function (DUF4190)